MCPAARIQLKSLLIPLSASSAGGFISLALIDGVGYAPLAPNFRFLSLVDLDIAAATTEPEQYDGYYAAIAFDLEQGIGPSTTGTLTVSFADGILGDEVVPVTGADAGDFTCVAAG